MTHPNVLVGYMLLFAGVGGVFLLVNMLIGKLLRPDNPTPEKKEIYECGEPTIGSSFVQFDLRFYVVALIFIVFDAEVAFLYPLSTLFGKTASLADAEMTLTQTDVETGVTSLTDAALGLQREMGIPQPILPAAADPAAEIQRAAKLWMWSTFVAINLFFVVLLVGFAYEWKTGSLDWVKAVSRQRALERGPPAIAAESVLSA